MIAPSTALLPSNNRANEMWSIIRLGLEHAQSVVDFGCGYGDLAYQILRDDPHARVICADKQQNMVEIALSKCKMFEKRVTGFVCDLDDPTTIPWASQLADVAICTSVLPYVRWGTVLVQLAQYFNTVFIECQYRGDGPGLKNIESDTDFSMLLQKAGFEDHFKMGSTDIIDRGKSRSIWKCYGGPKHE